VPVHNELNANPVAFRATISCRVASTAYRRSAPALLDVLRDGGAHATFFVIDAHVTEATALRLGFGPSSYEEPQHVNLRAARQRGRKDSP